MYILNNPVHTFSNLKETKIKQFKVLVVEFIYYDNYFTFENKTIDNIAVTSVESYINTIRERGSVI